jgi:hypothetical protein
MLKLQTVSLYIQRCNGTNVSLMDERMKEETDLGLEPMHVILMKEHVFIIFFIIHEVQFVTEYISGNLTITYTIYIYIYIYTYGNARGVVTL